MSQVFKSSRTVIEGLMVTASYMEYLAVMDVPPVIENPSNPGENLARQWREKPASFPRFKKFANRLARALADWRKATGLPQIASALGPVFGEAVTTTAVRSVGLEPPLRLLPGSSGSLRARRNSPRTPLSALRRSPGTPSSADDRVVVAFVGLTPPKQHALMKAAFGDRFSVRFNGPSAKWVGWVTPFEGAASYLIRIEYTIKDVPRVRILDPQLVVTQGDKRLPHTYPDNESRRNRVAPPLRPG